MIKTDGSTAVGCCYPRRHLRGIHRLVRWDLTIQRLAQRLVKEDAARAEDIAREKRGVAWQYIILADCHAPDAYLPASIAHAERTALAPREATPVAAQAALTRLANPAVRAETTHREQKLAAERA